MWTNYHTHTTFCDGKKSIAETIAAAIANKLHAVGFSSHAPLPFARPWCMKQDELGKYLSEIADARSRFDELQVFAGLEVDYIPRKLSATRFSNELDYTIGSVHFVDQFADGEYWEIDSTHLQFLKGFDQIFNSDIKSAVSRYYELTREMVRVAPPTIVGHLDKIKIQSQGVTMFDESAAWYRAAVLETLRVIRQSDAIVEVNTRGVYQKKTNHPYPSPWILTELNTMGIPVTLSSDAHHPDDLINGFTEAARLLLQAGFKKIRILSDGKWRDVGFDEHGIKP